MRHNQSPAAVAAGHRRQCGKCKAKIFAAHPEDVDAEIFDRQIARSTGYFGKTGVPSWLSVQSMKLSGGTGARWSAPQANWQS